MTEIVAVVVTHNASHTLADCLDSMQANRVTRIQVVDSGSRAAELVRIRQIVDSKENVGLLVLNDNVGFGAAVNRGVRSLGTDKEALLVVANPDTAIRKRSLHLLSEAVESGRADVATPLITTGGEAREWYRNGDIDYTARRVIMRRRGEEESKDGSGVSVGFVSGAFFVTRIQTFESLGGFDETYFMYWEDVDFCHRARQAGLRLKCFSAAEVWHKVGASSSVSRGKSALFYYYMQRNRLKFFSPLSSRVGTVFGPGFFFTVGLTLWPLIESSERWAKFVAGIRGLRSGWTLG